MGKKLVGNGASSYTFDASAQTVQISGITNLELEQILLINNATRETLIYNPFSSGRGYTSFSNGLLSLEFDTTTFADGDVLQIFYDNSELLESAVLDLALEIRTLFQAIANPIWVESGGMKLNPTTVLPTVTTVGTVTGVTTVSTVSTVTAMTTLATLSNITNVGGLSAAQALTDRLMEIAFQNTRNLIT